MLLCATIFINYLEEKELKYTVNVDDDGDVIVDFPYQGKITKCIFTGDDGQYLSLYQIYESVPLDKQAEMILLCNELNTAYKWVTFYVDDDSDLILHSDNILCPDCADDVAFERLLRLVNIADECKPKIMKTLYA
ncbi:MAG: YbjN domain-containing protein [Clostridia bacterium]|nr:YbjN domain-containing protein [Clostridia bacterium]